jgi:hypothetical protein
VKNQKKKTSDVQDRIEKLPNLLEEFQNLERAQSGTYLCATMPAPEFELAFNRRLNDLDKLFGFEQESQMRKTGVETSHWAGRR